MLYFVKITSSTEKMVLIN